MAAGARPSTEAGACRGGRTDPAPRPAPEPVRPAASGEPGAAAVRSMWSTVREKVRERSRTTEVMLAGAIVRGGGQHAGHGPRVRSAGCCGCPSSATLTSSAMRLKDALGVDWRVRCEPGVGAPTAEADPCPPEPSTPDPVDAQRAEEDSMIAEVDRDAEDPRRAAIPKKWRWSCCRASWAPGASTGDVRRQARSCHTGMAQSNVCSMDASGDSRRPTTTRWWVPSRVGAVPRSQVGAAIGGDRRTGRAAVRHRG